MADNRSIFRNLKYHPHFLRGHALGPSAVLGAGDTNGRGARDREVLLVATCWTSESEDGIRAEFSKPHDHTGDRGRGFDVYYWEESCTLVGRDDGWLVDE